uniref:Uncharacterized protein n=1 Tax=Picea sitchensis TaxID=3332 RepID=A0A6B9XXU5_PICSI|nr:hypothetical protein Q903MT_gene6881 [Picea sitchensis]
MFLGRCWARLFLLCLLAGQTGRLFIAAGLLALRPLQANLAKYYGSSLSVCPTALVTISVQLH